WRIWGTASFFIRPGERLWGCWVYRGLNGFVFSQKALSGGPPEFEGGGRLLWPFVPPEQGACDLLRGRVFRAGWGPPPPSQYGALAVGWHQVIGEEPVVDVGVEHCDRLETRPQRERFNANTEAEDTYLAGRHGAIQCGKRLLRVVGARSVSFVLRVSQELL